MDHFISMYIDNELSVEEKILFVNRIYGNRDYRDDAVSLLKQEKLLSKILIHQAPETEKSFKHTAAFLRVFGLAAAACLILALTFLVGMNFSGEKERFLQNTAAMSKSLSAHRFVIFQQGSKKVEITGSFTKWQKISLAPAGSEGYWEITLDVPSGDHRYAYVIDGTKFLPDPSVAAQEADDFGTMNSILNIDS